MFPKDFVLNAKKSSIVLILFLVVSNKTFEHIGLEYGLFSQNVKIKRTTIAETDTDPKNKTEQNNQYLNLKVICHNQNIIFLLKTTGLKLI